MKLLKFVNSDAPQTTADAELTAHRLTVRSKKGSAAATKSWAIQAPTAATRGGYWLLDDNNKPVCFLNEVMLAVADPHTLTCSSMPRGVTDADIQGVDLRSKLGRQLERSRAEYGATYKTAAKSARQMMNAEEVTEKRYDKLKRDREAVAEAVEAGEALPDKKASKRSKKEK